MPGPPQLSRARSSPRGRQRSVRPCGRMIGPRGPDRLRSNSRGSMSALTAFSFREAVAACADHVANIYIVVLQFVENDSVLNDQERQR